MNKHIENMDHREKNESTDPSLLSEVGSRIDEMCKYIGDRKDAAAVAGLSTDQLGRYIAGTSPRLGLIPIAKLCDKSGYNLEWVWSGKGPMLSGEAAPGRGEETDAQLDGIESRLGRLNPPFDDDLVQEDRDIYLIKQALTDILGNESAKDTQRARANLMLALAFGDEAAYRRRDSTVKDLGRQFRAARTIYEEAIKATGYEPPLPVAEAIKTIIFAHGLDAKGAMLLLSALMEHCNSNPT